MINWIIFSKDRAAQLDLLLRSMREFVKVGGTVTVIYAASNPNFAKAYTQLISERDDQSVAFIEQSNFKVDLELSIKLAKAELIGLLCDDDVFVREMPHIALPDEAYNYSLRLNPQMDYSGNLARFMERPRLISAISNSCIWDWRTADGDFAYPYSVSCTLWRKSTLLDILPRLQYHHPNSLEDAIGTVTPKQPLMASANKNPMVNIPSNLVQDTHANKTISGGLTAEELNDKFLSGLRISQGPLRDIYSRSPFYKHIYTFV